jgi:hypothetical protein
MVQELIECPRCEGNKNTEFLLLNRKLNCFTCNGRNYISQYHQSLFDVGFNEDTESKETYTLLFSKKFRNYGLFEFEVKRYGDTLCCTRKKIHCPNPNEYFERINNDSNEIISILKSFQE